MKKLLLLLLGVLIALPSVAQAEIEALWLYQSAELNSDWDAAAPNWASEDAIKSRPCSRFATGKDGRMYTVNMMTMSIAEITADGVKDLYKLPSLEGIEYDGIPDYYGTAISMDDAGNFLVGHYFVQKGLSSQIYTVYIPSTGESKHFDLGYPEGYDAESYTSPDYGTGHGLGRIDCVGRVCGDFTNEAVFFIAPQGQSAGTAQNIRFVYGYAGGDFNDLSFDANEFVGTYLGSTSVTNIVQPAITNISEYGETYDAHKQAYIISSTEGGTWDLVTTNNLTWWDACSNFQKAIRTTTPSKNNGFDTFVLNCKRYFVHGRCVTTTDGVTGPDPNNTCPMDIAVWDENGNIVAEWANPDYASNFGYNSIVAQAVEEEGYALIHVYVSTSKTTFGDGSGCGAAAVLKFTPDTNQSFSNLNYQIIDEAAKTVAVAENSDAIGEVVIPQEVEINGVLYTVTSISDKAFAGSKITSVSLPKGVTSIGYSAFNGCTLLKSVVLPNSITYIGSFAFNQCSALTSIELPNSIASIGNCAFLDCSSLVSIKIPDSVTYIGNGTFSGCTSLTSVAIPTSVTSIESSAFSHCTSLTFLEIPKSVTSIGNDAFYECSRLASIVIPNSVTSIGSRAFYRCSALTFLEIPNSITSIDNYMFQDCTGLTSVVIPTSITSIGEFAFYGCSGLTSVELPSSIESIGEQAFYGCSSLTSIVIPKSLTQISSRTFQNCSSLTSVEIPTSVTTIGSLAFFDCSSLTSIGIPNSVTSIGDRAFQNCSSLTSVSIPNSVSIIDDQVFYKCSSLTSVEIPNSITSIGTGAFGYCSGLTSVDIPDSVISIGRNAFLGCSELSSISIPRSVTSLGAYAFWECSSLTTITIPESVTSIGEGAFCECYLMEEINVDPNNTNYVSYDKSLYNKDLTLLIQVPGGYNSELYTIPESVTSIGESAFDGCINLTSVEIPNSVTSIEKRTFLYCSRLSNVEIPDSVTSIGAFAFAWCSSLTQIKIPEAVTTIGDYAFAGCRSLSEVYSLNPIAPEVESDTFNGLHNDAILYVPKGSVDSYANADFWSMFTDIREINEVYEFVIDDLKYIVTSKENHEVSVSANTSEISGDIIIPSKVHSAGVEYTVSSINSSAFEGCTNITSITISEGIDSIGQDAFYYCRSLKSIHIPESVISIGKGAFAFCNLLTSVNLPKGITSISDYAFQGCNGLTSFTIPESVISIGESAFSLCWSIRSVTIPESVISIGAGAFAECKGLISIDIPKSIKEIGDCAFNLCYSLREIKVSPDNIYYSSINNSLLNKDLTVLIQVPGGYEAEEFIIPESVTTIGVNAFFRCGNITTIVIPKSVASIEAQAFRECSKLKEIYSYNPSVPKTDSTSFMDVPSGIVLYVPKGCVENYANAEYWSVFSDIREIKNEVYSLTFNVVGSGEPVEGAMVTVMGSEYFTDERGQVVIAEIEEMEGSSLAFTVYKDGYEVYKGEADFAESTEVVVDVELEAAEAVLTVKVFGGYDPLEGAMVTFEGKDYLTDETGTAKITGIYGPAVIGKTFPVSVYKDGYEPFDGVADFSEILEAYVIADMEASMATLQIKVMADGEPVEGAIVTFEGAEHLTDANGEVKINDISGPAVIGKTLPVTVTKDGYEPYEGEVDFTETLDAYVVVTLTNIQTAIRELLRDLDNSDIKVYDLNGRRVINPQSGQFYIINGQKVLLKL